MKFILLANGGIPLLFESWLLGIINIPLAFIEFTSLFLLIKFQTNQTVPVYAFFFIFLGKLVMELSKLIFFGYLVCIHLVSYLILVGSFFAFR
ncbi:hypothetical protein LEP1GSC178_2025 [Leptospira licerasiae str. MMD4847]|uniref:DUF2568 domain-containing protein n=1 Tax=Leptospira licerasiae str. MMD4847 TaxID=1049971 RepID=A0ABN0HE03_9LEPT|nr:hypothetical protein LEP1GSC178_2025 [Leptospira licerasiae str. MMD4847]